MHYLTNVPDDKEPINQILHFLSEIKIRNQD